MSEQIHGRLQSALTHLTSMVHANQAFIGEINSEIQLLEAHGPTTHERSLMIQDQVAALKKLTQGVDNVTELMKQKIVACEHCLAAISAQAHILKSERSLVDKILAQSDISNHAWMMLVVELINAGDFGDLLDGIVCPYLRESDVEAFRKLCEETHTHDK